MADNKEMLICPACGKLMKKVFIKGENLNIDICTDGCGGILFDNRELEKFDEMHENASEILNEIKAKEFKKVDDSEIRICPICKVPMVKMGSGVTNTVIDVCNTCGAKFLDYGELSSIREVTDDNKTVIDYEKINEIFKENLMQLIGTDDLSTLKSSPRRQFFEDLVVSYLKR